MLRLLMLLTTLALLTGSVLGNIDQLMNIIFGRRGPRVDVPVPNRYVLPNRYVVAAPAFSYGFEIGR